MARLATKIHFDDGFHSIVNHHEFYDWYESFIYFLGSGLIVAFHHILHYFGENYVLKS